MEKDVKDNDKSKPAAVCGLVFSPDAAPEENTTGVLPRKKHRFRSIRFNLWIIFVLMTILMLGIVWIFEIIFYSTFYVGFQRNEISRTGAAFTSEYFEAVRGGADSETLQDLINDYANASNVNVMVFNVDDYGEPVNVVSATVGGITAAGLEGILYDYYLENLGYEEAFVSDTTKLEELDFDVVFYGYRTKIYSEEDILLINGEENMALVTTEQMFKKAYEGGYAVGAFNINNMEIIQAITEAAGEKKSPVILQVSAGARKYAKHEYLMALVQAAIKDTDIDLALHLDHGDSFELCKACIDGGFTSVMIDGSKYSFEENIELTKKVVEYAHANGVVVEGELGKLAGIEDDVNVSADDAMFTNPGEVEEFVSRTGVDSLAIAIGTSHGAYKFKPGVKPQLRFDILEEVGKRLPGFPIVLHGASSVIPELVKEINETGGKMPDAIGIPEDMLRQAARMAVCKINIDSDIRLAMTAGIRRVLSAQPDVFDPRTYLSEGRKEVKKMVIHKIESVLGSENKL